MLTVTYSLTTEDLLTLDRYRVKHGGDGDLGLGVSILVGVVLTLVGALGSVMFVVDKKVRPTSVLTSIYYFVVFIFMLGAGLTYLRRSIQYSKWYLYRSINRRPAALAVALSEYTVCLLPLRIEATHNGARYDYPWSEIAVVVDVDGYILIMLDRHSMHGFIVPKRAFPTPDMADRFYQTALAYWQDKLPPHVVEQDEAIWPPPPTVGP
jgi:hypothetical protein